MPYRYDFRIGTTAAGMQVLPRLGIPWPTGWLFIPYAQVEKRGDGQLMALGRGLASWSWETMAQFQLARLWRYYPTITTPSVTVYIRTHIGDERSVLTTIDRKVIMNRPVDGEGRTIDPRVHPDRANYTNVTVAFSRLEEV